MTPVTRPMHEATRPLGKHPGMPFAFLVACEPVRKGRIQQGQVVPGRNVSPLKVSLEKGELPCNCFNTGNYLNTESRINGRSSIADYLWSLSNRAPCSPGTC